MSGGANGDSRSADRPSTGSLRSSPSIARTPTGSPLGAKKPPFTPATALTRRPIVLTRSRPAIRSFERTPRTRAGSTVRTLIRSAGRWRTIVVQSSPGSTSTAWAVAAPPTSPTRRVAAVAIPLRTPDRLGCARDPVRPSRLRQLHEGAHPVAAARRSPSSASPSTSSPARPARPSTSAATRTAASRSWSWMTGRRSRSPAPSSPTWQRALSTCPRTGSPAPACAQWMFFEQNRIEAELSYARFLKLSGRSEQIPEAFENRLERGRDALVALDRGLSDGREFIAGDYSIADIALYAYVHCAEDAGAELAPARCDHRLASPGRGHAEVRERPRAAAGTRARAAGLARPAPAADARPSPTRPGRAPRRP